ncbi:MAG: acetyl-CoA synthetase [Thermoprotei archaeon]|nr:MAG: acetyl-CoA synthetase [Thermoprotei archaeon]
MGSRRVSKLSNNSCFKLYPSQGEPAKALSILLRGLAKLKVTLNRELIQLKLGEDLVSKLKPLFYPNSIAVIGASDNPTKLGYRYVKNLVEGGYKGRVYPVNPKLAGREVLGFKSYPSIFDVPEEVDLALIAVGARLTLNVLKDCASRGVKAAIVFASGFAESMGEEGRKMELEMRRISEESGMVIVGPNCLGIVNLAVGLNTLVEAVIPKEPGRISFISHSGSLMETFLTTSSERGFYISKAVSSGNEAATTLNDYLEYFIEDPETGVIAMYIEAIKDGRRFMELCRSTTKPLVALKAGRTEAGKTAAKSHTASLAGSVEVWNGVCKQLGIIQARSLEELYDLSMALACPLRPSGNRVAIITAPGGPAVLATDACEELGLRVPRLTDDSISKLRSMLPPFASPINPVDISASALEDIDVYERVLRVVASDPNVDSIIVIPPLIEYLMRVSKIVVNIVEECRKPIVVAWTIPFGVGVSELLEAVKFLGRKLVPNYFMPERAARALAALLLQSRIEERKKRARGS